MEWRLTVSDKFGQDIPGVDIQYHQSPEGGPVLLAKLPSHHLDNVVDLLVVYLQVVFQGLWDSYRNSALQVY